MRLPFSKPWRAFAEFDGVPDGDCRRYVADACVNQPWLTARLPLLCAGLALIAWPAAWILADEFLPVRKFVPLPGRGDGLLVWYVVTTVLVAAGAGLVLRDLGVYFALKRELRRVECPKCGQNLMGVPLQRIGVDPDPMNQFIRCPECGKKYVLMELGLTPRDLVPYEQRVVDARVGRKK